MTTSNTERKISMFCFQCQETAGNKGCTITGVCGKKPETANLQDLLIYTAKAVAIARQNLPLEKRMACDHSKEIDYYVVNALFTTITNANFDDLAIIAEIEKGIKLRDTLLGKLTEKGFAPTRLADHDALTFKLGNADELLEKAGKVGILATENEDIRSLRELITYGLKGMAAYYEHAVNLGHVDPEIVQFIEDALISTLDDSLGLEELVGLTLKTGEYGVKAMALLDTANTSSLGTPEITQVNIGTKKNPGILITGHDLNDLRQLLEQTEGTGVDVYTHSEMLPGHAYPELKKYDHLVGNYGNAWWQQKEEFETFNGPVVFTTNCIVPPKASATYNDRIFTTNAAGFPGWKRVVVKEDGTKDFSAVIEMAKKCEAPTEIETGHIINGFGHGQVFALADKVVEAVKSGAIKKFFVMGGCDARATSRSYYTEFAKALPQDTVILTAGCAKYRYNKLDLGDIGGIPRVLDAGQCNDSYSLAVVALKLKEIFELNDINELPIEFNIAWYEQKAVIVLLALLHLGVQNIHLGPTLPAFLSPAVLNVIVENFNVSPTSTVEKDIEKFLG